MPMTGWLCPRCGSSNAPGERTCPECVRQRPTDEHGLMLLPERADEGMEAAAKVFTRPYHDVSDYNLPGDLFRLAWKAMVKEFQGRYRRPPT